MPFIPGIYGEMSVNRPCWYAVAHALMGSAGQGAPLLVGSNVGAGNQGLLQRSAVS